MKRCFLSSVVIIILLAAIFVITPTGANAEIERFTQLPAPIGTFLLSANARVEIVGLIPLSPLGNPTGSARYFERSINLERGETITGETVAGNKEAKDQKRALPVFDLHLTSGGSKAARTEQIQGVEDVELLYYKIVQGQRTTTSPLHHPAFITRK